jgi:hypothetical protein
MTKGVKSAAATAVGRNLRAMVRTPWHLLRTGGRRPAPRSPATNAREADRRAVMRRVRVGMVVRNGARRCILCLGWNTAADRIAVCSLEKKLSRRP